VDSDADLYRDAHAHADQHTNGHLYDYANTELDVDYCANQHSNLDSDSDADAN
jgi:hypothetical protein